MAEKTSSYQGIYFNSPSSRWVVELERHNQYPRFHNERDAAIYAEFHYRKLYNESPNFPEMNDNDLSEEYEKALEQRDIDNAWTRSQSKQGRKKCKNPTSKYVGVCWKDGSRWAARIYIGGTPIYIKSFSVQKYHNAEILAAKAYDEKALELYGDEARLNFP